MSQQVRIPDEIYTALQSVKFSLDPKYLKAAPSIQDIVTVALKRLIEDWENLDDREQLIEELLEQRENARSRMGRASNSN